MIEIKDVHQSYGKGKVLDGVSLRIKENAITAIVGANGAGKSTLLGVITRILPVISGEVFLDGFNLSRIKSREIAKKIAVLKQTQSLNIRINVTDLVEFGRFPYCGGRLSDGDRAKVEQALDYMDLQPIKNKFIDELSGGQRQRAFIAMILAQDTPYIFLDEPLNNLDIKYSVEMMKIIRRFVTDLGKTIVVVLHDINFAAAYADYIVAMKDGKIVGEGPVRDMISAEVLNGIFDHNFHIVEHDGRKVCLYYDNESRGRRGEHTHGEHGRGEHERGEHGHCEHDHGEHERGEHERGEHGHGEHAHGEHSRCEHAGGGERQCCGGGAGRCRACGGSRRAGKLKRQQMLYSSLKK
ncbi:MAG: ATP-binding cassette domain-containing protein [Clostridiales bacterium]|jgi:iron complex transport system ATP-binding protein|nr:ATP-binding cassette domain-containing protein [Clostridiales bacterium]